MAEIFHDSMIGRMRAQAIYDEDGDVLTYAYSEDVEPVLDFNKAMRNDFGGYDRRDNGEGIMHLGASIPAIVIMQWLKEGFNIFRCSERELAQKLNDPNWAYLKTIPGTL